VRDRHKPVQRREEGRLENTVQLKENKVKKLRTIITKEVKRLTLFERGAWGTPGAVL